MTSFVIFSNRNEMIVTTKEEEENTIKEYFTNGQRVLDDYDRDERYDCAVGVLSKVVMD